MPVGAILTALTTLGATIQGVFNTVDRSVSGMVETTSNAIASVLELGDSLDDLVSILEHASTAFTKWAFIDKFVANMTVAEGDLVKLKTSLQDVTAGVQEYQKAMLYAAKTPFAVGEVVRAATLLRTFKFDPFEMIDMKNQRQLIDVLGDMAGAMGLTIADAAHALNRAMVGEWEIMQNRWQISAKMIPQLKGLASGTEEYGKAIVKYLSEQTRFLGGMELTAKSIRGLTSNIEDAFDIIKTAIGGTIDAENLLKGITLYDKIRDNLKKLYQTASDEAPLNTITAMSARYGDLNKSVQKLNASLSKTTDPKKQTGIKAQIDQQMKALDLVSKELNRNYSRLTGGEATYKKMQELLKKADLLPTGKNAKEDEARLKAQTPYLISTGMFNTNELLSQADKLQQAGRIIGQYLSGLYDLVATGIVEKVNSMAQTFLNGTQKFLDNFMDGAISIKNILSKDTTAVADRLVKGTQKYFDFIGKYIQSTAQIGTTRMQIFADDVKRILLETENPMYRQIQLFSVIVQLLFTFLQLRIQRMMDENPFFKAVANFLNALQDLVPKTLAIIGQSLEKFFQDNKDLINLVMPGITELTDGMINLGNTIDEELKNGGGVITNSIVNALQMAAGALGLFITQSIFFQKTWLGIGAFFTDVFTVVIGNIGTMIEALIIEPIRFLYNLITTGSITEAIGKANLNWSRSLFNTGFATADAQRSISNALPSYETLGDMSTVFSGMLGGKSANRAVQEAGYGNADVTRYVEQMNLYANAKSMGEILMYNGKAVSAKNLTYEQYIDALNQQQTGGFTTRSQLFNLSAVSAPPKGTQTYNANVTGMAGISNQQFYVNPNLTKQQQQAVSAFLSTLNQQQLSQMLNMYNTQRSQFYNTYIPQIAPNMQLPTKPINQSIIQQSTQSIPFVTYPNAANSYIMPGTNPFQQILNNSSTPLNKQVPFNIDMTPGVVPYKPFDFLRNPKEAPTEVATAVPVKQTINSNNTFTFNVIVDSDARMSKMKTFVQEVYTRGA